MLLSEDEYVELEEQGKQFVAKMGGEAVLEMLATLDLEELSIDLRSKIKLESSEQRRQEHLKRLRIAEAFLRSGNKPSTWCFAFCRCCRPICGRSFRSRADGSRPLISTTSIAGDQPQQPSQEAHRDQSARCDPAQRDADAAGICRYAFRQRPPHIFGQRRGQAPA